MLKPAVQPEESSGAQIRREAQDDAGIKKTKKKPVYQWETVLVINIRGDLLHAVITRKRQQHKNTCKRISGSAGVDTALP